MLSRSPDKPSQIQVVQDGTTVLDGFASPLYTWYQYCSLRLLYMSRHASSCFKKFCPRHPHTCAMILVVLLRFRFATGCCGQTIQVPCIDSVGLVFRVAYSSFSRVCSQSLRWVDLLIEHYHVSKGQFYSRWSSMFTVPNPWDPFVLYRWEQLGACMIFTSRRVALVSAQGRSRCLVCPSAVRALQMCVRFEPVGLNMKRGRTNVSVSGLPCI